jgi:hypothetical protein
MQSHHSATDRGWSLHACMRDDGKVRRETTAVQRTRCNTQPKTTCVATLRFSVSSVHVPELLVARLALHVELVQLLIDDLVAPLVKVKVCRTGPLAAQCHAHQARCMYVGRQKQCVGAMVQGVNGMCQGRAITISCRCYKQAEMQMYCQSADCRQYDVLQLQCL